MFEQLKDLGALMKQAQAMQQKVADLQAELDAMEIEGVSGGGLVKVTTSGKGAAKRVAIDPSLIRPEDAGVLEDLVVAAINDARGKMEKVAAERMQSLTGGLPLPPGFKL